MIKNELLSKILGKGYLLVNSINYHRHNHEIYSNGDLIIAVKEFKDEKSFQKESFFYEFFEEEGILRTPKLYLAQKPFFVTEFIDSDSEINLGGALVDWGRVHSYFMKKDFSGLNIEKINNRNLPEFVLSNPNLFGENYRQIANRLKAKINVDLQTLVHGDLYKANILTRNEKNYYIDFEFSGKGHPARDLALILLNGYDREKVFTIYKKNIDFDYPQLEEDGITYALMRGVDLIANLNKMPFDQDKKGKVHSRFINSMNKFIQ